MDIDYNLGFNDVNDFEYWTEYHSGCIVQSMKTLADRLNHRMAEIGMTQDRLAELAGVSQTTIFKLCSGKAKETRKLLVISDALGVSPKWLQTGDGPMSPFANIEPGPTLRGRIPLISWVQAGAFCQVHDEFQPGDAERWLLTTQNLGPHAYALRVKGDSMVNPIPGGHTYPEGSIVYVDPDAAVTNGCRVIAKIPDADEATFKVYAEDAGKRWLKPLNPQYPIIEMTEGMVICGVVRAVLREE